MAALNTGIKGKLDVLTSVRQVTTHQRVTATSSHL